MGAVPQVMGSSFLISKNLSRDAPINLPHGGGKSKISGAYRYLQKNDLCIAAWRAFPSGSPC